MSFVESDTTEEKLLNFSVVTLTNRKKRYLLRNTFQDSRRTKNDTRAVLRRLAQLHPPTAQQFMIKNKTILQAPLRLLVAGRNDRSQELSLSNLKSFIIQSYCWHSLDWRPTKGFHRWNGTRREWPISAKILKVLLSQRISDREEVWFYALCIDQRNESEKMHAITSMDIIYKSSSRH